MYVLSEHIEENALWNAIIDNDGIVVECENSSQMHTLLARLNKYRAEIKKQLPEVAPEYERFKLSKKNTSVIAEPRKLNTNYSFETLEGQPINIEDYVDE